MFEPPLPDLYGFGISECMSEGAASLDPSYNVCSPAEFQRLVERFNYTIHVIDELEVPEGLDGNFTLSWRWDAEQTPQVWQQCTDIHYVIFFSLWGQCHWI